jgi:hypothetical protein
MKDYASPINRCARREYRDHFEAELRGALHSDGRVRAGYVAVRHFEHGLDHGLSLRLIRPAKLR